METSVVSLVKPTLEGQCREELNTHYAVCQVLLSGVLNIWKNSASSVKIVKLCFRCRVVQKNAVVMFRIEVGKLQRMRGF